MKNISIIFLFVFAEALYCHSQEIKVLEVTGTGFPEEGAYNNAREQAVRQLGVRVLSAYQEFQFGNKSVSEMERSFYLLAFSSGLILKEDTIQEAKLLPGEKTNNKPLYEVKLNVTVKELTKADPYFRLHLSVEPERKTYINGEDVNFVVSPSKDSYITIFSITNSNRAFLVFPNFMQKKNFVKAVDTLAVNDLVMGLLPEQEQSSEVLMAIATKEQLPFLNFDNAASWKTIATKEGKYLAMNNVGAATEIAQWLIKLGDDQWTSARYPYTIIK